MKVFLSGTSLRPAYGGPAVSVARLADALVRVDVEVGLWSPDGSAPEVAGIHPAVKRLDGPAAEAMRVFGRPDVLHDSGLWLNHNHRLATLARKHNLPRVVSTRGMLEPWARRHKPLKKTIAWLAYQQRDLRRAAVLHATSELEAQSLRALKLAVAIAVIPNGVDIPEKLAERRPRTHERVALFIGRIYPIKGLPMLIEAWARVRPRGWRLSIAGPDEAGHLGEVKRLAVDRGVDDVVTFPGLIQGTAKMQALRDADLFILPTHSESFGMAVGEALANGLPVLTTTAAPWPALVDRSCGWRVAPEVDAIAGALRDATSTDSAELMQMGMRGREWIGAEYRWEVVASRFVACYESLLTQTH